MSGMSGSHSLGVVIEVRRLAKNRSPVVQYAVVSSVKLVLRFFRFYQEH